MNAELEQRLRRLTQGFGESAAKDPLYAASMHMFRSWLTQAEMAMEDEGVSNSVIRKVLNRMVYGHPIPADAPDIVRMRREDVEGLVARAPVPPIAVTPSLAAEYGKYGISIDQFKGTTGRNVPGQRDVSDLERPDGG